MALEVIFGASIPRELTTPQMEFLWVKWKTLRATNHLNLQRLTEETSHPLRPNIAYMVSSGEDFSFLYVGENVQAVHGYANSGSLVSEVTGPLASDFIQVYRKVASSMSPAFVRFTDGNLQSGQMWVRIVLPMKLTETSVMLVCYSEVVSHQIEVYEQLFRTAPDAMLIACAITNDAGHAVDGWVTMMNQSARDLLGYADSIANLRLSGIAQFKNIDLWGRLYAPRPGAGQQVLTTDMFDIEIMRFPHAFGLRIRAKNTTMAMTGIDETIPLAPGITGSDRERV